MSRVRTLQSDFRAGVLSPNLKGLSQSDFYQSGLEIGRNITVNTLGGITRRPGTEFISDYGTRDYVRIFPFTFNRDQRYVLVISLETVASVTTGRLDIYRDGAIVAPNITIPYNTEKEIKELDFAQSADVMIFLQGDNEPHYLRRLGSDSIWDFIPVPIINPPQYDPFGVGLEDMWTDALGWPLHCTFHQGRLWFAGSKSFPQHVWSSVVQDFFNFNIGVGDPSDSIQEALDTDFINPIVRIFSARALQVFTRGGEFTNEAVGAITPTSSIWVRQSDYGGSYDVAPVSVDGSTLYVDSTGRTIRKFTYADERGGYDSPSISAAAEHLVKTPTRMGTLRGSEDEPSNFTYVINSDGTIALLNLSQAHQLLAWTEWTTQGQFRDVITIGDEVYMLVERWVNSTGEYVTYDSVNVTYNGEVVWYGTEPGIVTTHWMLERLSKDLLVDSGKVETSVNVIGTPDLARDEFNFFGVYHNPEGKGQVVIVWNGKVVYQRNTLKDKPLTPVIDIEGFKHTPKDVFSFNDDIRAMYFDDVYNYVWYMYTLETVQTLDVGKNYIGGLTHLLGMEAVSNLDGTIYPAQQVVPGDLISAYEKTYPDGADWLYTVGQDEVISYTVDGGEVRADVWYNGVFYPNLIRTQWGYLLSGVEGADGSEYLEIGTNEDSTTLPPVVTYDADDILHVPYGISKVYLCACGAGGGGAAAEYSQSTGPLVFGAGGGHRGEVFAGWTNVTEDTDISITIGIGGAQRIITEPQTINGLPGGDTKFGTLTMSGGAGGTAYTYAALPPYGGRGANYETPCGTIYHDGYGEGYGIIGGGQAGLFGHGGNAYDGNPYNAAGNGGVGAGGGGISVNGVTTIASGKGGNGRVVVDYKATLINYSNRVRKMVLTNVTVNEGSLDYPGEQYSNAQAGLFFPVIAKTMPIDINAGAGSLINEPKRIVSVTSRYVDTQAVIVNGIEIPERVLGEEVLDGAPDLLTGVVKNRHLGYNRETSVTIIQNDPMPFTLLGIDVEVNF